MEELKQESPFIIKDDNFSIDIIVKYQTPNGINQKGITIYKKNCEINFLNDESLSNSVNMKKDNNNVINSFANIGFISISDIICFLYLTKNDIILLHDSEEYTYYKVKNMHYIKMIEINNNSDNEDFDEIFKQHFDQFKKYFVSENLFFSFCKYGTNILNHHIDSTNNICFNEKYFLLFKQRNAIEFITPLIKGFYTHLSIVNKIIKENNDINKDSNKENEENKEDNNKDDNSNNNNNNSINIDIIIKYKINQTEGNLIKLDDILNEDECIQEIEVILYRDITDKKINYKFYSYSGKSCNDIDKLFQLFKADKNIIKGLILIALDFGFNNTGNDKGEDLQKLNEADIFDVETTNDSKKNSIKKFVSERIDKIKNIFVKDKKESEDDKDKNIIYDKLLIISGWSNNSIFNLTQEIIQSIVNFYYEQNFNKDDNDDTLLSKAKSSINNFFYIIDELLGKRTMKLIKLKFPKVSYVNKEYIKSNLNVSLNMSLNINNNNTGLNLINDNNKALNNFSLFILTYNVCGMNKENINSINFSELLFPEQANKYISSKNSKKKYPLFFCIGLEEVVNLNAKNVIIGGEKEKYALWEEKITSELKSKNNYVLLTKSSLVGILFFIFVQASEVSKISNIKNSKTKTGFYGQLGNKGSCFVEFEYKNKKYGFNNGHLAAGENIKSNNERKINLLNILNHKSDKNSQEFYQNDFYFILGDLNFRVKNSIKIIHKWLFNIKFEGNQKSKMENINENKINTPNQNSIDNNNNNNSNNNNNNNNGQKNENENKDVESNASSNYTSNITEDEEKLDDTFYHIDEKLFMKDFGNDYLKYDQLNIYKEELTKFNIKESNILFYPTYKYAKKSNDYNLSKREPSWTDRILFKGSKSIKSVLYNRIDVDYSDHKPVFSIFEINY